MKLLYKGKFDGDYDKLPSDELEKHPDAVPFKEETNLKKFMIVMNIVSVVVMIGLYVVYVWVSGGRGANLVGVILSLIALFPHELLHAICFHGEVHMYIAGGGAFVACSEPISKGRFIFMSMLPNMVLGFIPFIIFLIWPNLTVLGTMGVLCISMGVGDYYNVFNALTQVPRGGMCFMHKQQTYWYMPEKGSVL